jgi:hypothetical protein
MHIWPLLQNSMKNYENLKKVFLSTRDEVDFVNKRNHISAISLGIFSVKARKSPIFAKLSSTVMASTLCGSLSASKSHQQSSSKAILARKRMLSAASQNVLLLQKRLLVNVAGNMFIAKYLYISMTKCSIKSIFVSKAREKCSKDFSHRQLASKRNYASHMLRIFHKTREFSAREICFAFYTKKRNHIIYNIYKPHFFAKLISISCG